MQFPNLVKVDIPTALHVQFVFIDEDALGEKMTVIIACAPFAIAVGIEDGAKLVFFRRELQELQSLEGVDDVLLDHLAAAIEQLDNSLHAVRRSHLDGKVAKAGFKRLTELETKRVVDLASNAEKH